MNQLMFYLLYQIYSKVTTRKMIFLSFCCILKSISTIKRLQPLQKFIMNKLIIVLLCLLLCTTIEQSINPILLLPTQTTQNVAVDYAFRFETDTAISNSASIAITFPFEYDPRQLVRYTGCFFTIGTGTLQQRLCTLSNRTFTMFVDQLKTGITTIVFKNIKNPLEKSMSSHFSIKTLFRDVKIAQNLQFGKLPFTKAAIIQSSTGLVYNYENKLVEQGSTWVFKFTLAGSYSQNSTIRFVFPEGFTSNKIQCNITGIVDSTMQTRVFPQQNIYDCLNVKATLSGSQNIILSGIVNPKFQMQMEGLQVQVIQPNNLVILEKIDITNQPMITAKSMNATVSIPNNYRNNTVTYIFQINMDSTLDAGDYMELTFQGNWTFFLKDSKFIQGIDSDYYHKARFESVYNWPTNTKIFIRNFSQISKQSQTAFYLSLRTPLANNFYNLTIKAFRQNNKMVQFYTRSLEINQTTGYIRQMRLHPMIQPVKLPVGKTGPLEITLALRNNLPKTNVLTFGKVVINIIPHIPVPNVAVNGVVKCYFYGDILAKNCTYQVDTSANPTFTKVTAYTPVDFNFQSSQIPFMVTTEGYVQKTDQGLTIDTLVKRYHFHVQFYTDYSPSIPTQVIFTDWIADPIALTDLSCNSVTNVGNQYTHLKCQFTTPNQILNSGHLHILRLQFLNSGFDTGLGNLAENIYPDYPCLIYGPNIKGTPYPKCDLYTYVANGPYKSKQGVPYMNVYGIQTIPPSSVVTMEFPKIKLGNLGTYATGLTLTILQDTYGYQSDYIQLYSQTITLPTTQYTSMANNYISTGVSYTMSNSVINKVSDLTLSSINLGSSGCDYVILEVPSGTFPDIGRAQMFACGTHLCSKFNYIQGYPVQYFILYPSSALSLTPTLVFPAIKNPATAGTYTFYLRAYRTYTLQKKISFSVTVTAEPITTASYTFASYQTISQMYPNTDHFYKVSWTIVNTLPEQTSYIEVVFSSHFTLSSTYCDLTTSVAAWDGRGIQCEVWSSNYKVIIGNMQKVNPGDTFTLNVQMRSSLTTAFSPTVTIKTYVNGGAVVDQWVNGAFTPSTISNTNLQTLTSFDLSQGNVYNKQITKGYFGDLIINYDPAIGSMSSIYYLVITLTNQFYPYSNVANLPLSCIINNIRRVCSYSLSPFTITISGLTTNYLSTGNNVINITTQYLQRNGIFFPVNQGRYLIKLQAKYSNSAVQQNAEHFIDIKPDGIQSFVVNYVHRDAGKDNIFIAQFQNGPTTINAYNHPLNASRIYIGFPTTNSAGSVFSSNLGFTNGTVVPCYFQTGLGYVTAITGKNLQCRLRKSPVSGVPTYVQIINFATITPSQKIKVFMGKILNPSSQIIDVNFNLKINYFNPSTYEQTPQYENEYNMFFDMLSPSIYTGTVADKTSPMFQAGANVGDQNKYFIGQPYSMNSNVFQQNDWFIISMSTDFLLNGVVNNCINSFYKRCIVYKQINWVAININNGTLIQFYPQIIKLPESISRVDTTYQCYVWISQRWKETLTYTISTTRWLQLRGSITGFKFQVLGSQNKLNIGQKDVDVLVTFTVSHKVPAQGTIQIQFPSNSTRVPSIKPHCRSAVTLGSKLMGMKTPQPATNTQGQVGCLVQNSYSWLITSYQELNAGSQVMITGKIDLPTVLTTTLGTGYIVTYATNHATNVFANGRTIDYLTTNFPLQVQNKTWNLVEQVTLLRSEPLRVGHTGKFEFKLQMQDSIRSINDYYSGYLDLNFWTKTILGDTGGFSAPATNKAICSAVLETTGQKLACMVTGVNTTNPLYISYRLKFYYALTSNTPYLITLTTQKGDSNQGIPFPSTVGTYKIQTQIQYYTNWVVTAPIPASKAHFIQVYGPKFTVFNFVSTISIPGESNLILVQVVPSQTISNSQNRLVMQIPTVANENVNLFDEDLGMGYRNYDDLVFDLYQSDVTSMKCKFYIGDRTNKQPVRIICNQFNINVATNQIIRFGFWVKNPTVTASLAVPIQVYIEQMTTNRKLMWQMLEAGIKLIPTTVSPINDYGNFLPDTTRQLIDTDFKFTNRNTKPLQPGDYYIMKFNFDLRKTGRVPNAFKYPYNTYSSSGDAIFLQNSRTILLKVGTVLSNWIAADAAQSNKHNILLDNVIYNPAIKLTSSESQITAYAVYLATQECQKIIHKDSFPDLYPNQPSSPDFQMIAVNSNDRKGQYQDYIFKFRVGSNTNLLKDSSLVKKISIQFPAETVYDFKFRGQACIQDPSSDIQISKCYIDTSTATIWIDPVQKNTYQNNYYFVIQTLNNAIINPLTKFTSTNRVYTKDFVIKYYTWNDDTNPPAIIATSDDFVFMKQDSTQLSPTNYLTYNAGSTTQPHHNSADFDQHVYTNQFLPLSTDIGTSTTRAKTPFEFKFIAMTSFANKQGQSGQKHSIKLSYNPYYSVTAGSTSNDLSRFIPICELNGYRILDCVHDTTNKYIQMNFQQGIAAQQQVSVRFSVLDPVDNTDDGFALVNTNNPVITFPIWITPYLGTPYYMQPQPFSTFYRSSGISYPSMGIVSASVIAGSYVYNKLNYLEFSLAFSRNDINGLVLQIPLLQLDGSLIYKNSKMLNLQSGSDYPCSVGRRLRIFCHYQRGQTLGYGKPTRIYISKFQLQGSNTLSFRMLFQNPDIVGVFPSFIFKAYGGTIANQKLMGQQFMGQFRILNAFKTISQAPAYYDSRSNCTWYSQKSLFQTGTNIHFYIGDSINANNYVILQWSLHNPTYGQVTQYNMTTNTDDYDQFFVNYAKDNRKLYMVKKLGSNFAGSGSSYYSFGHFRNKHFFVNDAKIYYLGRPWFVQYTCGYDESWHNTYRTNNQYAIGVSYLDIQDKRANNWGWQFLSIDMGLNGNDPTGLSLNSVDPGQLIVAIKYTAGKPYMTLSSGTTDCQLEDGLISTNLLNPITCTVNATSDQIIFRNANIFNSRYLKFYYYAKTINTNISSSRVQMRVYASNEAFLANRWAIFYDDTDAGNAFTLTPMYLPINYAYSNNVTTTAQDVKGNAQYIFDHDTDSGDVIISSLSSTQIQFKVTKGTTKTFSQTVYKMVFRFYVQRLSFSGTCSVITQPVSRSGRTCSISTHEINLNYSYYSTSNTDWPDWTAGQVYTFKFGLTITGQFNANYLFASFLYTYYESHYYDRTSQCGACRCDNCHQNKAVNGVDDGYYCCGTCYARTCWNTCYDWDGAYSCNPYPCDPYTCCATGICYYTNRYCRYFQCRWFWGYGGQFISGQGFTNSYAPTSSFASSVQGDILTYQRSYQSQLMIQFNSFSINVGPSYKSYVLIQLNNTYSGNNPFPYTKSTQYASQIDCKCLLSTTGFSLTASTTYLTPQCVRYLPTLLLSGMSPSIAISLNIAVGQSLRCYFPGYLTTSAGTHNIDTFVQQHNYLHTAIPRMYWSRYQQLNAINVGTDSNSNLPYGFGFDDFYDYVGQNNYWTSAQTSGLRYYDLNISSTNTYQPQIYMSMYSPAPNSALCTSYATFSQCRFYDSFINRRYFLVFKSASTSQSSIRIRGNAYFPPSQDNLNSYYNTLVYWNDGGSTYIAGTSNSRTGGQSNLYSILSPATSSNDIKPAIFGSFLQSYNTSMTVSVSLSGKTLYSYLRNTGQYRGSFVKVTFTSLSSLTGCSATLQNRDNNIDYPFFCQVISNSQINIFSRYDLTITEYLYFTIYSAQLPSSCTYTVNLYDKYVDSSDYARSYSVTGSFSRPKNSLTPIDRNYIQMRKMAYKQYRVTNGPIRFTLRNTYIYVSDYNQATYTQTSTTDAIVVYLSSGLTSGDSYVCFVKQYKPFKKHLSKNFLLPCGYWSNGGGNKIYIKPAPAYSLNSQIYQYQFTVYRHTSGSQMFITLPTADVASRQIISSSTINTQTIAFYDYFDYYKYKTVYPCALNSIYVLTKQAAALNSLYIDFTLKVAGNTFNILQFQIPNLGLSSFKISNGQPIACYLSTEFATISGKTQSPRCYGFTNGIKVDSPLVIRVFGMASWAINTNFKLAFDNFNNPALQTLFLTPIDITFRYLDKTSKLKYVSYWPSVYLSDSINIASPSQISGSLYRTSNNRGFSNYHYTSISWPYTSYGGASQKLVLKLYGGITCCSSFSSIYLRDDGNTYTLLWTDTQANMSVYRMPSYNSGTPREMQIRNVNNPYPYQRDTYQKLKKIQMFWYNNYQTVFTKKLDQFSFASYYRYDQITVDNIPTLIDVTRTFDFHQQYPVTYKFAYSMSRNQFNNRKLSYTLLTFSTVVTGIQWAYASSSYSPFYFNDLLQVTIGKLANNSYYLNISGMSDSSYSSSNKWYITMRFFASSNSLSYTSQTYNLNGELQFTNSRSWAIPANYSTTPYAPTFFHLRQQKYFKNYYELQRIPIYAKTASTSSKLQFRFKTPYAITNQQTLTLSFADTTQLVPQNTPNDIYCLIRKTLTANLQTGISYWSQCTYTAGKYIITNPIGNLAADTQYTLTIVERNQSTTSFKLPYVPKRIDVSQIYTSQLNLLYGDVYQLNYQGRMTSFSIAHASWHINQVNMIGVTFTPGFTLVAASTVSPITETILQLEIHSKQYEQCGDVKATIYDTDSAYFASGTYFSHYASPPQVNSNTRIKCGQYTESFAPIKLTTTDYGQVSAGTSYYFRYPLIRNPSANPYIPFIYRYRLLQYKNGIYYPVVISSYQYEGLQQTRNGVVNGQTGQVLPSNDYVQTTMGLSFRWPNFNQGATSETWVKLENDVIEALTDITSLKTITTSDYTYQYYPNINLCVYLKTTNNDVRTVSLGSFPTPDDQRAYRVSWAHLIYSDKVTRQAEGALQYWTNKRTSWDTSSFTIVSGLQSTFSEGIYRISFKSNSLRFVEGSYMKITFSGAFSGGSFTIMDEYCKSMSGFTPGSLSSSNLVCKKNSATQILIQGYQTITNGTPLSFDIYLKIDTGSVYTDSNVQAYIQVISQDDKPIIQAYTNYLSSGSFSISQGSYNLDLQSAMRYDYMKDTARQLFVKFQLASNSLGANQYVQIDFGSWKLDTATTGTLICKYQTGSNYYWIPAVFTPVSGNKYRFGVYKNISTYSIAAGTTVTLRIDQINPDGFYGVLVPDIKWNYLKITAHSSSGTVLEHQYAQIWIEPYEHLSLAVQPALDYVDAISIYEFTVTPNVSATAGDSILLQFTTADGLYSNLFPVDLGKSIATNDSNQLSCRENNNVNIISNTGIKCQLFAGTSSNPIKPVTIQIKIQKNIPANQAIAFNILSLKNPNRAGYPIGVTFKLANVCYQLDQNRLCTYYKSTKYIYFQSAPSIPVITSNFGSMAFNPNYVSATPSQHTLTASVALTVGDFVKIVYYNQVPIPSTCSLSAATGICYSYPLQNTILIKATVAQSPNYTFTLTGMTNLYQYSGSNLYTQVWSVSSTRQIAKRFYTSYQVPIITTDPTSNNPLNITFTPTLTPDYHLSYLFDNIARVQISYIYQNKNIQQILVTAPSDITLNSYYCNATLQSTVNEAKPYPYRFKCTILSSLLIRINLQSDFPAWTSAFINKKVVIYIKYQINQNLVGLNCSNWKAQAFTHASLTTSMYKVSQAGGKFTVSTYMSPYIYNVDFFTLSFTKRICLTGDKCMFYGYLLPSNPMAVPQLPQIKYFDFTIPSQFQYSNLQNYDKCDMKEKNGVLQTFGCVASRNNSKVTIRLNPTGGAYNHNYKIIRIDHSNSNLLFTAPQYPGTHYQMKVDLYNETGPLLQSQYVNVTTVYGSLLNYNDIQITIPKDSNAVGVFEFTFKVGSKDIQPAYQSSATNRITSAIQIIFSKSFLFDLGTGKKSGEQVSCLPVLNLNLATMGKLTCRIYPSYSTITYPTIIVTGYDKILSGQVVTWRIAGLTSLAASISDYIKIGVSYKYYDYGNVKGYLYEPTGKVVGTTSAPIAFKNIAVNIVQSSTNFVGQLANYTFTCTLTAGFANVQTTDYIVVEFPPFGFEGRFNMNEKAKCTLATGQACQSFGLANVVYFKPSSAITSTSLTFSINNMINTAFSYDYKPLSIKVYTLVSGKIDSLGTGTITKFSKPSMNISGLITKSDSIYGGQSGINYYIDFKLGSYLPEYGKVSITFPSVYPSLFDLNSKCNFTQQTFKKIGQGVTCQIVDKYQVIIAPNGLLMDTTSTYGIIISNLTNPNANISKSTFIIQSLYGSDIYNRSIISQNIFYPPTINVISVKNCQFDLTIQTKNQNYKSLYSMSFICPSVIKEASRLQVYLPWSLSNSEKQLCTTLTSSLYSYQCSIKNEYINNKPVSFMQIYLRQHVPQKLIMIKGQITNGVKGSYSLNASISFKGFTYLRGTSNKIYIDDTTVSTLRNIQIQIQNYPYNRNYESLYTFKITNPKVKANSLRIQIPPLIKQGENGITCNSQISSTNKDYFMFLVLANTTSLNCSMNGQSLLITGLSSIITSLKDDQFLFLDVFGLKNPDVSTSSSQFKFTFLNITDSTGNAIGGLTQKLSYRVSQAPYNLQINDISLTSRKFEIMTTYSLTSSTIANSLISINSNSQLGIKVQFPIQYQSIWSITSQPSQVKVYLGSSLYTSTKVSMVNRKLMAKFTSTAYQSFSQIKVEFVFRNPSININCTASNFIVSLFDFKLNSIVSQTVGNNIACPQFSDKLFWIKVSGNSQIQSGNFSDYTIQIQRPAKYLKIRPVTTSSAISFSPQQIIFENYNSTIQKFRIKSSPAFTGSYLITFTKTQSGLDLFYNDIKNETVKIIAPLVPYLITFEQITVKSIGDSIQTFINIEVPSSTSFALLHSNNCSSSYEILPQGRIQVPAGSTKVSFSVKYKGSIIPYMCSIKFQISSLTNINYALSQNTLYISGEPSIDRTNFLRPMLLRISKQPKDSKDVGSSILTSDPKSSLKPVIYELKDKNIAANTAQLSISLSQQGFIYYAAMQIGTQRQKVTQKMIYDKNVKTGIIYNNTRVSLSTIGSVNIISDLYLEGLQSDKVYLIGAYLNSTVGISDIKFKQIKTSKSSNGAVIKISLNSIQSNTTIIDQISTVLRVKPNRLSVFTQSTVLIQVNGTYQSQVMNQRRFIYEIVLAPNRLNDSIPPIESFKSLISSKDLQNKLKSFIPSFDLTYTMTTHQLIIAKPKARGNGIQVQLLTDRSIRVSVAFWQPAYVYGVIIQQNATNDKLLSKQIKEGLGRSNSLLNQTHRVATQTDSEGFTVLQFKLLQQLKSYTVYITAQCILPYDPRPILSDQQVLSVSVKTRTNLNVPNNGQKIVNELKKLGNQNLAKAVQQHLNSVQQKKLINEKPTRIRKRN